jgi:hypothetical protein
VRIYGAEYRGVVNYYLLAQDVARLTALRWNAESLSGYSGGVWLV